MAQPTDLRAVATGFTHAFIHGNMAPSNFLTTYMTPDPSITEHGHPTARSRLPFVAQTFTGRSPSADGKGNTCDDYFVLLGSTLALHADGNSVPDYSGFVVDSEAQQAAPLDVELGGKGKGVVMVKANAELEALKTGKKWREEFVMCLSGFEGGKFERLEIWADNLSAWEAVGA